MNTALMSALMVGEFGAARGDPAVWGRLVESAVGAHLLAAAVGREINVHYWLENRREVDFVLEKGGRLAAIEVKTGRVRDGLPGMRVFMKEHASARPYLVGRDGMDLETFFSSSPEELL